MVESGYRELVVLRHAKTEQDASSDRTRKLTSRGRADARAAGRWLRDNHLEPDVVLTSPASRAHATAELVCAELRSMPTMSVVEALYGASPGEALEVVATVGDAAHRVVIVGHNPTMEDLAYLLQRNPSEERTPHLPTAGMAVLRVAGSWSELAGHSAELLRWEVPRG